MRAKNISASLAMSCALALASGCARPPRPAIMAEAERTQKLPSIQDASSWAPEAFARAEKLRRDAETAYRSDDLTGAQVVSERAIAAYQHAVVLARIAHANRLLADGRTALEAASANLSKNESDHKRVAAEADDFEVRVKVIREAAPISPSSATDSVREEARLRAARSLALDARLLCAGARMIDPSLAGLGDADKGVDELDRKLREAPHPAPIDAATRARAQCLAILTAGRRAAAATSTLGEADNLLAELSAMGTLSPVRDDRGVVVTLPSPFHGEALSSDVEQRLRELGRVAAAHPSFPLELVLHAARAPSTSPDALAKTKARGEALAKALVGESTPARKLTVEIAGNAHPLVPSSVGGKSGKSDGQSRSDRVEIVFVDPGG